MPTITRTALTEMMAHTPAGQRVKELAGRKESDLVRACLEYLAACGIMAWRNNSGGMKAEYKGKARFMRFGAKGSGDILGILPGGRFLSVECKVGKNTPTPAQEDWARRVRVSGGMALTVWTVEGLEAAMLATVCAK